MADVLYLVVEGDGDKAAAPSLIRRFLHEQHQRYDFTTIKTFNAEGRGRITTPGGLEEILNRVRRMSEYKGVIVLLDTERQNLDCPPEFAVDLAKRARALNLPFPVVIVCATCEYESWFLANLHTIAPKYLQPDAQYDGDPEMECGAKGWLDRHMLPGRTYKETIDQPPMTALIDIPHTLQHSRSFRRLNHAVEELLLAIDAGKTTVTPTGKT